MPATVLIGALLIAAAGVSFVATNAAVLTEEFSWGNIRDTTVSLCFLTVPVWAVVRRDRSMFWVTVIWYGIIPTFTVIPSIPMMVVGLATADEPPPITALAFLALAVLPIVGCMLLLTQPSRRYFGLYPNIFGPYRSHDEQSL